MDNATENYEVLVPYNNNIQQHHQLTTKYQQINNNNKYQQQQQNSNTTANNNNNKTNKHQQFKKERTPLYILHLTTLTLTLTPPAEDYILPHRQHIYTGTQTVSPACSLPRPWGPA
jgi:hypothetical protein